MSSEGPKSRSNSYKSLKYYFTKTTNFIDENLRIIQYSLYGVAAIGVVISLRSLRMFSKFNKIEDIPQEFISKQIKLRGVVSAVKCHSKYDGTTSKQCSTTGKENTTSEQNNTTTVEQNNNNITSTISINNISKEKGFAQPLKTKLLQFLSKKKIEEIRQSEELVQVYLHVSHLPIIQRKMSEEQNIVLRLASVQVTKEGAERTETDLKGKKIWFIPLRVKNEEVLDCIIRPFGTYVGNYGMVLVKNQIGFVEPFDETLKDNKAYRKYYRKLLKHQNRQDNLFVIVWKKIRDFLFKK